MEDREMRAALDRHWAASDANDFAAEHEIYREDAVLEYPQSGERIRGRRQIQASRTAQPNQKRFTVRRIVGTGDLWVTEFVLTYDGRPSYTVSISGPTSSGRTHPTSTARSPSSVRQRDEGYPGRHPLHIVGSCTNSSYEDMDGRRPRRRAGSGAGSVKSPLLITPGSEQVRATLDRDGLLASDRGHRRAVLTNTCGPCIGQWHREHRAGRRQHDRQLVQPQLPRPQRRPHRDAVVHRQPGDRHRLRAHRELVVHFVHDRPPRGRRRAVGARCARACPRSPSGARGSAGPPCCRPLMDRGAASDRPARAPAGDALARMGRRATHRPGGADEDPRQVHHRSHLTAGPCLSVRGHLDHLRATCSWGPTRRYRARGRVTRRLAVKHRCRSPGRARVHEPRPPWVVVGDSNYGEGSLRRAHGAVSALLAVSR